MSTVDWFAIGTVVYLAWFLSHQAGRLDRLHHRIETSSSALDAHLARRAGLCAQMSACPGFDLASGSLLAQAAHDALACDVNALDDRMQAENALSQAIFDAFEDADDVNEYRQDELLTTLLDELVAASKRVQLSRRFHADAVRACRHIRDQRLVRLFHLAGHATLPTTFDFMDELPDTLS